MLIFLFGISCIADKVYHVFFYFRWHQDTVEILLRHQGDVNARDKNWQTPLHVAAASNAVKCAEFLIPQLGNVNVSDRAGRTSLHHAAFNGHLEVEYKHSISQYFCPRSRIWFV